MEFTRGTKRFFIAKLYADGYSSDATFAELRPKVTEQVRPWIFSRNVNGARTPKPMAEQYVELQHEINRVYSLLDREGRQPQKAPDHKRDNACDDCGKESEYNGHLSYHEGSGLSLCDECIAKRERPEPKAKGKTKEEEKRFFYSEWKRLRRWISETIERTGAVPVDSLDTMRPVLAARALIDVGISAKTLLYAMCLHWPQAARDMAGIETVDFATESEDLGSGFHHLAGYVRKLAEARQNAMLIGPAGTGKSLIVRQVASLLRTEAHPDGLPYGETPMTPGATRGDLLGRHTLEGFIPSQFVEIYSGGGIFNFEEIDAADPGMLIVVNNALASDRLFNSANGQVYDRHPDFIAMATANTFGLGADAKYTGREKLDLATIDRFRMGRVLVDLDDTLATHLMFG